MARREAVPALRWVDAAYSKERELAPMPLFIATACHSVEACPAGNPEIEQMLFSHVSQANATKYGIYIQASAVAEGKHTLYLILEASDSQKVQVFMNPFDQIGTVEVTPGTTCEAIVAR